VTCFVVLYHPSINVYISKKLKIQSSMTNVLTKYISEFEENVFSSDGSVRICELYEIRVPVDRIYTFT